MEYYYESRFARLGELVQVQDGCCGTCEYHIMEIAKVIMANMETGFCKVRTNDEVEFYLFNHEYKVQSEESEESETLKMCNSCGCSLEDGEDTIHHTEHGLLCDECFENEFFYCGSCDTMCERGGEAVTERNGTVCENCFENYYFTCAECGEVHRNSRVVELHNGNMICSYCYENSYFTCDDCGEVYDYDDQTEVDDCYYCSSCAGNHTVIGDYHPTHASHFYSCNGERTERYIGFELEVEARNANKTIGAKNVLDLLGPSFIECKRDGSLNNGFEIVTQPATFAYHAQQDYEGALQGLVRDGLRSHDPKTCGLHFHVSRDFFRDENGDYYQNIAKLIVMLNYNWSDIVKFSRRNYDELDQWAKKAREIDCERTADEFVHATVNLNSRDRYQALNLTNSQTIEFRFFRGTLRAKTFRASMEWVELFTNFAVSHTLEECFSARWNDIFGGASDNFKEYTLSQKVGIADFDHDTND